MGLVEQYQPTQCGRKSRRSCRSVQEQKGAKAPDNGTDDRGSRKSRAPVMDLLLLINAKEILKQFYHNGLPLDSFLKALDQPETNQIAAVRFFHEASEDGFPNLNAETDYNDFVPSMKNFACYLGFAEATGARGRGAFTPIARQVLELESGEIAVRSRCDVEICRKVCPAEAYPCRLYKRMRELRPLCPCCPYNAVRCEESKVDFNFLACTALPWLRATPPVS